jgi:hypothetical protein
MEKNASVAKALFILGNLKDRKAIGDLDERDHSVLRDIYCSGVNPSDAATAIKLASEIEDPLSLLTKDEKSSIARGADKKVLLVSYLTSESVREAYPISPADAKNTKDLYDSGNFDQAVNLLQRSINSELEKTGRTRRVVVELGVVKTRDIADEMIAKYLKELPSGYQAMNFTPFDNGKGLYVCEVRGSSVGGVNKKLVSKVAKVLAYRVDSGTKYDQLKEIPGIKLAARRASDASSP